ncbi:hypothetical protein [Paenibacillus apiarius]|uniref:Uncharacterized protein n=1 Tax=Paenibacillus apiarius TaxID=46240 RepID=A0ABT4DP97_9BACL|nr:hypothetical protein [Paenibacillus apiarius]MCY9517231.1 hypothetical protein [Paenibacillus apiarius]MCY9519174.1 hypothetical protein [Paenibacillus apiarius]MCY9551043.1 hypothetical protein [Paenibacillus apiarius]MCY9560030.1 hypothetical protein [Paenibacillus apiarius]MCY9683327.1 hypothetical protein [Paenibacillus apiarius]
MAACPAVKEDWGSKRDRFLLWLIEACGLRTEEHTFRAIEEAVQSEQDVDDWHRFFHGDTDALEDATDAYIGWQRAAYSKIEFMHDYYKNRTMALEKLFRKKCSRWEVAKLDQKIVRGELSAAKVYNICATDEWYNSLSKIVRATW